MRKPFHQHIVHHAKKYGRHFTKYLYERDTILATIWVFTFIILVKVIPMPNVHFFDPLEIGLSDFDINDIHYSTLKEKKQDIIHDPLVIVNIGENDREGLALLIDKVSSMKPKVIGLDVVFWTPRDPYKDSLLRDVFRRTKNLVVANKIDGDGHHSHNDSINNGYFGNAPWQRGYVNFFNEEEGTVRMVSPSEKIHDSVYYSFTSMLIKNYDLKAFEKLQKRHDHYEIINYTRRQSEASANGRQEEGYLVIEPEDLMEDRVDTSWLKDKIVLMGYVNNSKENIEDKFFTPLNPKFAGKSHPDMNGIIIHANIISMVLAKDYIKKLPSWVSILVAILIGWLHMSFFIRYYLENHIWFHLVAKFTQLLSAILFVYLGTVLYNNFSIKINMTLTLVVIVLAVDIIYFYEAFAVWLHKKYGYRTVFHQKHH